MKEREQEKEKERERERELDNRLARAAGSIACSVAHHSARPVLSGSEFR